MDGFGEIEEEPAPQEATRRESLDSLLDSLPLAICGSAREDDVGGEEYISQIEN